LPGVQLPGGTLYYGNTGVQSELYFNASSKDICKVVSELNQINFKLFGKYRKSSQQLYTLLQTTNGLLGKGPEKLLSI
jgi:hypothetical protein